MLQSPTKTPTIFYQMFKSLNNINIIIPLCTFDRIYQIYELSMIDNYKQNNLPYIDRSDHFCVFQFQRQEKNTKKEKIFGS